MVQFQRVCIFCSKAGLSREHVWADWLKNYIPKNEPSHDQLSATIHKRHADVRQKKVPGDLRSRRLRVVCKECNTGWMSKLQENTKPFLLPLIKREDLYFDGNAQEAVAAWITMFVMVAEYFDTNKVSTPQFERQRFMATKLPPPNWKIWVGDFQRENWRAMLAHFAVPISASEHDHPIAENGIIPPNTQTMTFVVGRLYVHVRASVTDIFDKWSFARSDLMMQIWPKKTLPAFQWPLAISLTDADADAIAADFHRASDAVAAADFFENP